jgi:hypothetical protein
LIHSESDQFKGIQRPQAAPDTAEEEPVKTNKPVVSSHSKVAAMTPAPVVQEKNTRNAAEDSKATKSQSHKVASWERIIPHFNICAITYSLLS